MSKDELVKYLIDRGYRAENENGVVMIRTDKAMTAKDINDLHDLIRNSGYNASYGWGVRKNENNRG